MTAEFLNTEHWNTNNICKIKVTFLKRDVRKCNRLSKKNNSRFIVLIIPKNSTSVNNPYFQCTCIQECLSLNNKFIDFNYLGAKHFPCGILVQFQSVENHSTIWWKMSYLKSHISHRTQLSRFLPKCRIILKLSPPGILLNTVFWWFF